MTRKQLVKIILKKAVKSPSGCLLWPQTYRNTAPSIDVLLKGEKVRLFVRPILMGSKRRFTTTCGTYNCINVKHLTEYRSPKVELPYYDEVKELWQELQDCKRTLRETLQKYKVKSAYLAKLFPDVKQERMN